MCTALLLQNGRRNPYYKIRELLQNAATLITKYVVRFLLQNVYYKTRQFLQNGATLITKYVSYYKMHKLLQDALVITKCRRTGLRLQTASAKITLRMRTSTFSWYNLVFYSSLWRWPTRRRQIQKIMELMCRRDAMGIMTRGLAFIFSSPTHRVVKTYYFEFRSRKFSLLKGIIRLQYFNALFPCWPICL